MQRPVMDPMQMLVADDDPVLKPGRVERFRAFAGRLNRAGRAVGRVLFAKPFRLRRRDPEQDQPVAARFAKAMAYRLLFAPIFLALAASAYVYRGTHPLRVVEDDLPAVPGVFYETVQFNGADDGYPLMGWFVPVVDAKRVLEMKEKVYRGKQPAVVLVHDYNASPSQMVPLVQPLHEQGYVVMVVGLRGIGRGRVAAQTFGLNEASDVRGALKELKTRSTVDAERIAVIGVGSGANASLIAAAAEPGVKALVLINPMETPEAAIARHVGPTRPGLRWMQQPAKWAFEVAYYVDADDLQLARFRHVTEARPTVTLTAGAGEEFSADAVEAIRSFCVENLPVTKAQPAVAGAAAAGTAATAVAN
jgi:pimeloyl-ACP methyl ester carboxylesterase